MRLFMALELPDELREAIAAWQRGFEDPALRPVPAENLHMTLVFLGSRDPGDVDTIAEAAFSRVDSPAPVVAFDPEPVGRPRGKRPGLFALGARSPQAEVVQAQVVDGLVAAGLHEREERPFWPHVTVARVHRGKQVVTNIRSQKFRPTPLIALTLFRSQTKRDGAVYEPMAELELPPAETER